GSPGPTVNWACWRTFGCAPCGRPSARGGRVPDKRRAVRARLAQGGVGVPKVAVVAHTGKSLGGGLGELREVLAREGVAEPLWYEMRKSRKAPKCARKALAHGAEMIFVWGGDGTVQRCIDAVAGTG